MVLNVNKRFDLSSVVFVASAAEDKHQGCFVIFKRKIASLVIVGYIGNILVQNVQIYLN